VTRAEDLVRSGPIDTARSGYEVSPDGQRQDKSGKEYSRQMSSQAFGQTVETIPVPAKLREGVRCNATKTDGNPCKAWAVVGLDVCHFHGGATPKARNAAFERRALHMSQAGMELFGPPVETSPEEALLDELHRTAGHIAWLREQIATSDPTMFAQSMWMQSRQSGYIRPDEIDNYSWSAAGAIWVKLYMEERKHLVEVATRCIAAGIEERRVRIAERGVEQVGNAIQTLIQDLGFDPHDPRVRAVAFKALMSASGQDTEQPVPTGGQ